MCVKLKYPVTLFNSCRQLSALALIVSSACCCCQPALAQTSRQVLQGHVPAAVANLSSSGSLPAAKVLHLAIGLPLRNQEALTNLLQQLYNPASPNYRQWLTPENFTERFGPTDKDYQALIDFAKANRLNWTTHPNRVVFDIAGTVSDIEKAFHVALRVYHHPTEARDFYAPDREPSLDLTVPILNISGLDDYSLPHPRSTIKPIDHTSLAKPNTGSGPSGSYLGADFR